MTLKDGQIVERMMAFPTSLFNVALSTMQHLSTTEALSIAEVGAFLALGRHLTDDEIAALQEHIEAYRKASDVVLPVDFTLEQIYNDVRAKTLSWDQAAKIAERMLGREIKPDALRKRITRWAEENNRAPVELRKPNKEESST